MGRIVSSFFTTLDGVVESPHEWHFPYFDEDMGKIVESGMQSSRAFLLGRKLYDEWSAYWPAASADQDFADFINDLPKYVVSTTLTDPSWNATTVLQPDPAAIRALKDEVDGDIGMSGSATTVRWLLAEGLLDELNLLVDPIAVGAGQRLFQASARQPLELLESRALDTGVLHLRYRPLPRR
jgi:dihydrofolate reductase